MEVQGSAKARPQCLLSPKVVTSRDSTVHSVTAITSPEHFVFTKYTRTATRQQSPKKPTSFQALLQRMKKCDEKRKQSLERARKAAEAQAPTPRGSLVNKASKAMVSSMVPIHERFQQVIADRKKHIDALRSSAVQKASEQETAELRFSPQISPSPRRRMTPDKFYQYNEEWAQSNRKRNDSLRQSIQQKEMEGVTFKPAINESPRGGKKPLPIQERWETERKAKEKRLKDIERANRPSFSPMINRTKARSRSTERGESDMMEEKAPADPPPATTLSTLLRYMHMPTP